MNITTFAAIYIGSYEINLKIFEISQQNNIHQIDYIRSRIEIGKDVYSKGNIGYELVEDLCEILNDYYKILSGYQVDDYKAFASSVIRDAKNGLFVLEQIRMRTKINVKIMSNSEQRLVSYKAIAANDLFANMIEKGAAVVDIGGGSIQITIYQNGNAITTQHIALGTVRIREKLSYFAPQLIHYEDQVEQLIDKEISKFNMLYLKESKIPYMILTGNYITEIVKSTQKKQDQTMEREQFLNSLEKLSKKSKEQLAEELYLTNESDPLLVPTVVLYSRITKLIQTEYIWVPGVNISDGIAHDYGEKKKIIKSKHDFDKDVLSAAGYLAKRYHSYSAHTEFVLEISCLIFDAMKKMHGLTKRERLLLQTAAVLHDCGRYISLVNQADCTYEIIMATEIIGMSHLEREIVASAVKYNEKPLVPFTQINEKFNMEGYMVVAKLAAILKVANALDRSQKQKCKNVKVTVKDKKLLLIVESTKDLTLEEGLFKTYTIPFEQIFSIKPVIKDKRIMN